MLSLKLLAIGAALFPLLLGVAVRGATATWVSRTAASVHDSDQGYVRMCTGWQIASIAEIARELIADHKELLSYYPTHLEDAQVAERAQVALLQARYIDAADRVLVAFRKKPLSLSASDENDIVRVVDPGGAITHYAIDLDATGKVVSVRPVANDDNVLTSLYDFVRTGAAYVLLNDLMASDTVIPRRGCSLALRFQIGAAPEVLAEVEGDLAAPPVPDPADAVAIQRAYSALEKSPADTDQAETRLTRSTLRRLGATPGISIIYRDQDTILGTGRQYIVVRLVNGSSRAYALLKVDAQGAATFAVLPLCVVGDTRCAQYYLWP